MCASPRAAGSWRRTGRRGRGSDVALRMTGWRVGKRDAEDAPTPARGRLGRGRRGRRGGTRAPCPTAGPARDMGSGRRRGGLCHQRGLRQGWGQARAARRARCRDLHDASGRRPVRWTQRDTLSPGSLHFGEVLAPGSPESPPLLAGRVCVVLAPRRGSALFLLSSTLRVPSGVTVQTRS